MSQHDNEESSEYTLQVWNLWFFNAESPNLFFNVAGAPSMHTEPIFEYQMYVLQRSLP